MCFELVPKRMQAVSFKNCYRIRSVVNIGLYAIDIMTI